MTSFPSPALAKTLRVVLLPALLLLASGLLGCYYETNDDAVITLLLRGVTAAAPVTDLHLYFHGWAALLAALYQHWPAWPWYGLLLYALLYAATVLAFAVLDHLLRDRLAPAPLVAALALFFGLAWLEHGLWFNYVRVPILLAGGGLLYAAQRAHRPRALLLGLLALGLAWLIRPSAALLGVLAAAPGVWWLARRRGLGLLLAVGLLLGTAQAVLSLRRTPAEATYRRLDVAKSNLLDYHLTTPRPRTAADTLALAAVGQWAFGDSTQVNEALFRRAVPVAAGFGLAGKPGPLLRQLARDYFPLLLLQLLLTLAARRTSRRYPGWRWFGLVQLGYVGLVLGLGLGLKLPPRVVLPLLDLWALSSLAYVGSMLPPAVRLRRLPALWAVGLAALTLLYGYKTGHRVQVLRQEQARNEARLRRIQAGNQPGLLVAAGLETLLKARSPFREPAFAPRSVLTLTGWPTLDPSQAALRQHLTGTRAQRLALRRLAARPGVRWVLTPAAAVWLRNYLAADRTAGAPNFVFIPALRGPAPANDQPQPYRVGEKGLN